jgi:hypothetical protein
MIRILPRPQHIEEREGRLLLDYHCRITMDSSCPSEVFFYASQLAEQLKKSSGIELLIDRRTSGAHKGIVLCMSEEAGITRENKKEKEAYRLEITPEGVTVCAAEKEGLLVFRRFASLLFSMEVLCHVCISRIIRNFPCVAGLWM